MTCIWNRFVYNVRNLDFGLKCVSWKSKKAIWKWKKLICTSLILFSVSEMHITIYNLYIIYLHIIPQLITVKLLFHKEKNSWLVLQLSWQHITLFYIVTSTYKYINRAILYISLYTSHIVYIIVIGEYHIYPISILWLYV